MDASSASIGGMNDAFRPLSDLLLSTRLARAGGDPRELRHAFRRGELVRLRRGAYCPRERWATLDERNRHLALAHAVVQQAREPIVLAGLTAAAVWGMPVPSGYGPDVVVLDSYRGGGRSEPGVRRTTQGAETAEVVQRGDVRVTSVARTALEVARGASFEFAVGSVDWALWRKNPDSVLRELLERDLARFAPRTRGRHLERVVAFATDRSDSFGESRTRAVVHELGFAEPTLQFELVDREGRMFADFAWPEARVILEFDGDVKFSDPRYSGGDPVARVRAQRAREARLRRLGWTIIRLEWRDLADRDRVMSILRGAGVPRREN